MNKLLKTIDWQSGFIDGTDRIWLCEGGIIIFRGQDYFFRANSWYDDEYPT